MKRDQALTLLREHRNVLVQRCAVADIAVVGSTARDVASDASDIDTLVRFDAPADAKRYFGMLCYLEDLFGRSSDLVTDRALREEFRLYVEREAIRV